MVFSTKKRFIAGVVCPKCSAMDKLQAFSEEGLDYRECVSCGFKDRDALWRLPRGKLKPALTQLTRRLLGKLAQSALLILRVNSSVLKGLAKKPEKTTERSVFDRFAASETYSLLLQSRRVSPTT